MSCGLIEHQPASDTFLDEQEHAVALNDSRNRE